MYALVEILGKQYNAEEGKSIQVDLVNAEIGAKVSYDSVLAVVKEDDVKFGAPYVEVAPNLTSSSLTTARTES